MGPIAPVMLSEGAKVASKVGARVIIEFGSSIGAYVASDKLVNEKYRKEAQSGKYTEEELKKKRSKSIVKVAAISGIFAGVSALTYLVVTKKIDVL
jgi:DNA-directed RNA polymerase